MTYVLRHELVNMYAQHKFSLMRQELLKEEVERQRVSESTTSDTTGKSTGKAIESSQPSVPSNVSDSIPAPSAVDNEENCPVSPAVTAQKQQDWFRSEKSPDGTPVKIPKGGSEAVKDITPVRLELNKEEGNGGKTLEDKEEEIEKVKEGEKAKEKESVSDEKRAMNEKYARELNAKLQAISADNLGIVLNANCFIDGFECDVDPVVALKDEECARGIADFLYKHALVGLTEQVRSADFSPFDSEALVVLLHAHGVNMRYLGKLAYLAYEEEKQDKELLLTHRQKIQAMPYFWLEMLEIEIFSRCFKHFLNVTFRSYPEIRQCYASTIASLLNFVFGKSTTNIVPAIQSETEVIVIRNGDSKKKKKNKNKNSNIIQEDSLASSVVPESSNVSGNKEDCLESLQKLAKSRFCLESFALMFQEPSSAADSSVGKQVLSDRISPLTLLRRICQVRNNYCNVMLCCIC